MHVRYFALLAACSNALGQIQVQNTATCATDVAAAAATARTDSKTSNVRGKVFDRYLQVMLETTSYGNATADRNIYICMVMATGANSLSSKLSSSNQAGNLTLQYVRSWSP